MSGRVIALDVGEKTIGVALSDPLRLTAQPLTVIQRQNWRQDVEKIRQLVQQHEVTEMVVGVPVQLDGRETASTEMARAFMDKLKTRIPVPLHAYDERLSTVAAERTLLEANVSRKKRKGVIDKVAAAIFLQAWLDAQTQHRGEEQNSS